MPYNGRKEITTWWKESTKSGNDTEEEVILKGSKYVAISTEDFVFKTNDVTLLLKAYKLESGKVAISFYEILGRSKKEKYLRLLIDEKQVFEIPDNIPSGLDRGLLFSPVGLGSLNNGQPTFNQFLTPEKYNTIPDAPKKNAYDQIVENKSTWLESGNGKPLIHYEIYDKIVSQNREPLLKGKLVSLIDNNRTDIMALNFFRTKIIPVLAESNKKT